VLFEIPSGYTKMDMGEWEDDDGRRDRTDEDNPAPKEKSKGIWFQDAIDLLK
jgi:hypothetical protein